MFDKLMSAMDAHRKVDYEGLGGVTLGALIDVLFKEDPERVLSLGLGRPHSYRGYYEDLSFEKVGGISVGEMAKIAQSCLGKTFMGWKGGEFQMSEDSLCWVAEEGSCGELLTSLGLKYFLST